MGYVNSNYDNSLNHEDNNNESIIDTVTDVKMIGEDFSYEIGMGNFNSNYGNSLNHNFDFNNYICNNIIKTAFNVKLFLYFFKFQLAYCVKKLVLNQKNYL